MARWLLPLLFALPGLSLLAQGPYWAMNVGGAGNDHVADLRVDDEGSIYATGEFTGLLDLSGLQVVAQGGLDVFVARFNYQGQVQWVVSGGGSGIDRGISIAVADDGTVAVAGQFMGEAVLFGQPVSSAGGTLDAFVGRLNATDGSLIWLRTGGGSYGADRPNMVACGNNSGIVVTGEFRGNADFSGIGITSMIDPQTLEPSADVFVLRYDAAGDVQWLKHGAGEMTDRGVAVAVDANDAVYVTGQFSDTLLLDTPHNNTLYNATFLVKYDAAGNEEWFRKCGGALLNQVRDLRLSGANEPVLLGDLRGTTHFYDAQPDDITASWTYAYYVMRISPEGEFVNATTLGSHEPLTARGLAVQADSVAVLGEFKCRFSGLSDLYGDGFFMATGDPDLFVTKHRLSDLGFTGAQQYGGHNAKRAGRIAMEPGGNTIFSGGYAELLVFPEDGSFWTGTGTIATPVDNDSAYCGDPHYWAYGDLEAVGGRDGFLAQAYAPGRPPYDVWRRDLNAPCSTDALDACLYTYTGQRCDDTVNVCYPPPPGMQPQGVLMDLAAGWNVEGGAWDQIGFEVSYAWSDGSTGSFITPSVGGWYWCTATANNGCWSWTDSVYVVIYPSADPLISDATGTNSYAGVFQTTTIMICDSSTWIWDPIIQPTDSIAWFENGVLLDNDSAFADTSGIYTLVVTNAVGCISLNAVPVVQTLSPEIPNITGADLQFFYDGEPLNGDTVLACNIADCVGGVLQATWYVDGVPSPLPPDVVIGYLTEPQCAGMGFATYGDTITWSASFPEPGWFPFTFTAIIDDLPCGQTSYIFTLTDSVFIELVGGPTVYPPMGDLLCDNDTFVMTLGGCVGCDSIVWEGPGVVDVSADGFTAWLNEVGDYTITGFAIQDGMACPTTASTYLEPPIVPPLFATVPDGMICQGDSLLLWTTLPGYDFDWMGPGGSLGVDNDSVWVSDAGEYVLSMIGWGCAVNSAPFEVQFFGTPYIEVPENGTVLCPGGSLEVNVIVDGPATIAWQPPLSGSSPTQVITAAGQYTCIVTSCGQVFEASINVIMGTPQATLVTPGPFVICDGTPVELEAWPGQELYEWQPVGSPDPLLVVTDPGSYWFYVSDAYGCTDTSATVLVTAYDIGQPLVVEDLSLCEGSDAVLNVEGSGTITWYSDPALNNAVHTGTDWTIPDVSTSTTYYVQQVDGPCTTEALPLVVNALPTPQAPVIDAAAVVCDGDALVLTAATDPGTEVNWGFGNTAYTGAVWTIAPVTAAWAGTYTCSVSIGACSGPSSSVEVDVADCTFDIPNVITPNGDGRNDGVLLNSPTGTPMHWIIQDRWGLLVRELEGATLFWNGIADGGGVVADGVYYYVLTYERPDGRREERTGYIQVLH